MLRELDSYDKISWILLWLYLFTLPVSIHLNSLLFGLLMVYTLYLTIKRKSGFRIEGFSILCMIYFLMTVLQYFNSTDRASAVSEIEQKLTLLFMPSLLYQINERILPSVLVFWSKTMAVLFLYLLVTAFYRFWKTGNTDVFFYHEFCFPIFNNAIYVSLIVAIALFVSWFYYFPSKKYFKTALIFVLYIFLLFLSSKNIVIITSVMLLILIGRKTIALRKWKAMIVLGITGILLFGILSSSYISKRIREASRFNVDLAFSRTVSDSTQFDGTNLRLRLWSYGLQILEENNDFAFGVSPADSQKLLDQKIISSKMYVGDGTATDKGFLGYNFHNQYMQTLVESGITGLILLASLFITIFIHGYKNDNLFLIYISILIACAFITESYLNRQVGLFTFLSVHTLGILLTRTKTQVLADKTFIVKNNEYYI